MPRNVRSRCAAAHITLDFQGGPGNTKQGDAIPLSQPGIRFCSQDRHPHTSLGNHPYDSIPPGSCQPKTGRLKGRPAGCRGSSKFFILCGLAVRTTVGVGVRVTE